MGKKIKKGNKKRIELNNKAPELEFFRVDEVESYRDFGGCSQVFPNRP